MDRVGMSLERRVHLQDRVYQVLSDCQQGLLDNYGITLAYSPKVSFDLRGRSAGQATWRKSRGEMPLIRINIELLHLNEEEFLSRTVPHEFAHIVVFQRWPGAAGHGREWKQVMRMLGVTGDQASRCHSYDTTLTRVRRSKTEYQYSCGCGEHWISATRHGFISRGRKAYRCCNCRQTIVFAGARRTV